MLARALALALVLGAALPARAETRRVALVVGSNAGAPGRQPLRYAESDAGKVARVLAELGGVDADDLLLLQGQGLREVQRAFDLLTARIAELHRKPELRVVLVFYFSGHSDGQALELGADRLGYAELRKRLTESGAEVRLAVVDSCQSGGLLTTKGGRAGPAFDVQLSDELETRGSVFLTSSAATEYALESSEVQGSYFTHHWVSGLRGAADASGDGRVTLAEAYRYAFDHTVAATADTRVGPQHPRYDYQLSGQGELVLTELRDRPSASLRLPEGLTRALVMDLGRDQVVAEVGAGAPGRLTMAPGKYAVRVWRGAQVLAERVELRSGEERQLAWADLREEPTRVAQAKGGPLGEVSREPGPAELHEPAPTLGVVLAAGAQSGPSLGAQPSFRAVVENAHASGFDLGLSGATQRGSRYRENLVLLRTGLRLGTDFGPARPFLGVETGLGAVWRSATATPTGSPLLLLAPRAGLRVRVQHRLWISLETEFPLALAWLDGRVLATALPAAVLGLEVGLL